MKILKDTTYTELLNRVAFAEQETQALKKKIEIGENRVITPGPTSIKDLPLSSFANIQNSLKVLEPEFDFEAIPLLRQLTKTNPDVSQAFNDVVRLANTGHKVIFDPTVGPDQIDAMRNFILSSSKNWHVGSNGINGIVNKMLRQVLVGGAISMDWVPNMDLTNLEEVRYINPENIRYIADKDNGRYYPYQKVKNRLLIDPSKQYRKLNINQYHYVALNGDTDLPYGIPPYLSVLTGIQTQSHMLDNMRYIVETLGVLGWIDAKIAKPNKLPGENDADYTARLNKLLQDFKARIQQGMRDGVSAGFKDDHEFEFKQTAKTAQGAKEIFELNEMLISSSLNYDAAFMGRPGSTETLVTILFTKMIAQLKNIQDVVADNLEFGYALALTLGGFKFKTLSIRFNRSTISDDLKFQQADEIKIRNLNSLYDQGIIGQDAYADEMGLIKPDQTEPRVSRDPTVAIDAKAKVDGEKKKDANDKKNRDKNKPGGTTRGPRSAKTSEDKEEPTIPKYIPIIEL
jgi:hypothetical protein